MPRLANMLEMNRYIVYAILASIWIISLGTAVPTFNFRRFNVNFSNFCMHTSQIIFLIFFFFLQILEFKDYTQFMCVEGEFSSKSTTICIMLTHISYPRAVQSKGTGRGGYVPPPPDFETLRRPC